MSALQITRAPKTRGKRHCVDPQCSRGGSYMAWICGRPAAHLCLKHATDWRNWWTTATDNTDTGEARAA